MARLKPLLRYALLSNRRAYAQRRSALAKGVDLCIAGLCAYFFCRQIQIVVTATAPASLAAAEVLCFLLSALWLLLPLSVNPGLPASLLTTYPLSRRQLALYRLLSHWLDWKSAALLAASVVSVVAAAFTPPGLLRAAQAAGLFLSANLSGSLLAEAATRLQTRDLPFTTHHRTLRKNPLFRKELAYYARTLDPYAALLFALAAAYTELLAPWMTPAKTLVPLLLIGLLQLPAALHPFALDSPAEQDRYRSLPISFARIVANKHQALAMLFLLNVSPFLAALFWQLPWLQSVAVSAEAALVLIGLLLSGLILMHMPSARRIQMRIGGFAGQGLTLELFFQAAVLSALLPLAVLFLAQGRSPLLHAAIPLGFCLVSANLYLWLLSRQRWLPSR
jgi:hypothetical protein